MPFSSNRPGQVARDLWSPQWLQRLSLPLRIAIRTAAVAALLLFLLWLALFVTKGRFLKQPFERFASSYSGRVVTIGGEFHLYFDPFDIRVKAEDLRVTNPDWARADHFITAGLFDGHIETVPLLFGRKRFDWLRLDGAHIALEYDRNGKRNTWTFGDSAHAAPLRIPTFKHGAITQARVDYIDQNLALETSIAVDTLRSKDSPFARDIQFAGTGSMRKRPFHLAGSLLNPNEYVSGAANVLILHAESARAQIDVTGTVPAPFQFKGAQLRLSA